MSIFKEGDNPAFKILVERPEQARSEYAQYESFGLSPQQKEATINLIEQLILEERLAEEAPEEDISMRYNSLFFLKEALLNNVPAPVLISILDRPSLQPKNLPT